MTYRDINRATQRNRLDQSTWAEPTVVVFAQDVDGTGGLLTDPIDFGAVFSRVPFFRYGVEVREGSTPLVTGDFPAVVAGVSEWTTTSSDPEDPFATQYYIGATVYLNVVSYTSYALRFRFSFEGVALKNTEYYRGAV